MGRRFVCMTRPGSIARSATLPRVAVEHKAPPRNPTTYVAEVTPLELGIVRHAAVAVLYR
jgi:hypothetical protein